MYRYGEFDRRLVRRRAAQFRAQAARRLSGELTEEEFKPLRLMNGVYLQLHAYMLRVAIPYGALSSEQLRRLADLAERYDRGFGHFTTRQNIQFNWPALVDIPDMLEELADVEMHAIQTSGNCVRNVTCDHWAGAAEDEIDDPRPIAELLRQWSSLHPEFSLLPRKFKIAATGAPNDRAAVKFHDIGLIRRRRDHGELGWEILVGGGQGRTPMIASTIRDFLSEDELLLYVEAIMRVYNLHGRRDNKYKARIKILFHELGAEEFSRQVEEEFASFDDEERQKVAATTRRELSRIREYFSPPPFVVDDDSEGIDGLEGALAVAALEDADFAPWARSCVARHVRSDHAIVTISLKPSGGVPGDASSEQMRVVADLADRFAYGEIRVGHHQNLCLPHARRRDLPEIRRLLAEHGLAEPNAGLIGDVISCPGLDYCALATARSIPLAQAIGRRFSDPSRQREIGPLRVNISGCINACGHHHAGHIGILGLDKKGQEFYQISLGGDSSETASIGRIIGPGFSIDEVPDAIEKIVDVYLSVRGEDESFLDAYRRLGDSPFREALYGASSAS